MIGWVHDAISDAVGKAGGAERRDIEGRRVAMRASRIQITMEIMMG